MKTVIRIFNVIKKACTNCHGMKVIETPNDTIPCPACKGKGYK